MKPKYFVRVVISGSERTIMMMQLFGLTLVVIFGVVTSQNHDVNLQTPYSGLNRRGSVEATTAFPPDPTVQDDGMRMLLTRLETLCVEKLEYLITDTNRRFQSLENQLSQSSSCPASPVVQNIENLEAKVENLGKQLISDTNKRFQSLENQLSQSSSCPASPIVQNIENLEAKVENLSESIQELLNATRNLSSDVEGIKRNISSLINVTSTRSLVNSSSNSELKQIFNNLTLDKQDYPKNCREVQEREKTVSGTYMIQPERASIPFEAVCDLETRGGGWTVIQKRFDGSQDFYLGWQDYKNGFGNLAGEFWLGLEHIHLLTGFQKNELLIELGDFESQNSSAFYSEFRVGSEVEGYCLKILGVYSGDAGDSLNYNAGQKFSTKDNDQDGYPNFDCAAYHSGAWWYHQCTHINLNGKYFDRGQVPENPQYTVFWNNFKNHFESLKHTKMLVRPQGYGNNN